MDSNTDAHAALAEAERVRRTVDDNSRWYAGYLTVFGVVTIVAFAAVELIRGPASALTWGLTWAVFVTGISLYAIRQPVKSRGHLPMHFLTLGAMFAIGIPVLALGGTVFHDAWWWYPATAPAVALPFFVGACYWAVRT